MKRRTLLRGIAGVSLAGAVVGGVHDRRGPSTGETVVDWERRTDPSVPNADPPPEPPVLDAFERVVDITDLGVDPAGNEAIQDTLVDAIEENTLVRLPEGTYRIDETVSVTDVERFGIYGDDATIVPPERFEDILLHVDTSDLAAGTVHVEGLHFELGRERGARLLHAIVSDRLVVRNVSAAGTVASGPNLVRVDVTDDDGTGLVERLDLPDGAVPRTGITGCFVGRKNAGDLTFRDCRIVGFPDNGLYAEPPAGRIVVERGFYANNGIASVRVKNGSLVRGVHVRCDESHRAFDNMRGIRLTNHDAEADTPPAVVDDCLVELLDVSYSDGAIALSSQLRAGIVRNTDIRVDADGTMAIWAKSPSSVVTSGTDQPRVECEDVTIEGSAAGDAAIRVTDRDRCAFSDLCIRQTGVDRDGIDLRRSIGNTFRHGRIDVTGEPFLLDESSIDIEVLEDGSDSETTLEC